MVYLQVADDPCLLLGGQSGELSVYSIKRQQIVFKATESRSLSVLSETDDEPSTTSEI